MPRKMLWIVLGLVAVAVAGGIYFVSEPPAPGGDAIAAMAANPGFAVTASDHVLGNPKAKVTLIEYAAPRCPHCARFDMNVFPQLKQSYIDTGKIQYVFRVFPLSEDDGNAEKVARCLPKNQYFAFMDMLFRNQPKWDDEYGVTDVKAGLVQMARMAGMSAEQAQKCMDNPAADADINKSTEDAVSRYQVNSTPTIIINGTVRTPPPGEEWSFASLSRELDGAANP